jgi:hypothetical protein
VLEAPALEIRLEFLLHVLRQRPACGFARGDELGVVPLDEQRCRVRCAVSCLPRASIRRSSRSTSGAAISLEAWT